MPMYEYVCTGCKQKFDRLLPMAQRDEEQVCPMCGATAVRNAITAFGCAGSADSGSTGHGPGSGCKGCKFC